MHLKSINLGEFSKMLDNLLTKGRVAKDGTKYIVTATHKEFNENNH